MKIKQPQVAKWDVKPVELTDGFIEALKSVIRTEIAMMAPLHGRDCWTLGIVRVGDLCRSDFLSFEFGGDSDRPPEAQGIATVIVL